MNTKRGSITVYAPQAPLAGMPVTIRDIEQRGEDSPDFWVINWTSGRELRDRVRQWPGNRGRLIRSLRRAICA